MALLACYSLWAPLRAQSTLAPRALSLGAYGASVVDTRGFPLNPAGLAGIRDWDFATSTYTTPGKATSGFVFHGLALGKRLFEKAALAVQYSPGTSVRFVIPPTITLGAGTSASTNDREITYNELFSAGAACGVGDDFSAGIGLRMRRTELTETQYDVQELDTITIPVISRQEYSVSSWHVDAGVLARPWSAVRVGLVGRNLLRFEGPRPASSLDRYVLPRRVAVEFAGSVSVTPEVEVMVQVSSQRAGGLGAGWTPVSGFALRGGLYLDAEETRALYAVAAGVGFSYEQFEVDAAYLRFTDQTNRGGAADLSAFDPSVMRSLELHPYASDRLVFSLKALFGNIRPSLARIEGVSIGEGIYPAGSVALAYRPLGTARVRNISSRPIHAKVAFFVDRFMDVPTVSPPVLLQPDQEADVPLTAVFNERIHHLVTAVVREASVTVTATPADQVDDRYQARVMIMGRNAWNGDVLTLRHFVTPDDPDVLRYSRDVLLQARDSLTGVGRTMEQFLKARLLFTDFAGGLQFVHDPRLSADYVQYASETLTRRGGDCDDMAVLFASLLGSIGIPTAFVDVVPPGRPDSSHIYLLFDTGIDPRFGHMISNNPKRYVVRRNSRGEQTIWIPVETTAIDRGFDEAWTRGAREYFDDVEIGFGIVRGWVRVVDIQ